MVEYHYVTTWHSNKTYVRIGQVAGLSYALQGLSRSYQKDISSHKMYQIAAKLAGKGNGHDKFLEFVTYYLTIRAPRHWWQQFDAYRIRSEQSESTMHTLLKEPITQDNFEFEILPDYLSPLNKLRKEKDLIGLKNALPEGYLQVRDVRVDMKSLFNMYQQRKDHKNPFWKIFCTSLEKETHFQDFFGKYIK